MLFLSIPESILLYISSFGILQGFLLSGLLYFHPRSDRNVNKYLATYIAGLSAIIGVSFVLRYIPWQDSFFVEPFTFLPGPLLYFYVKSFKGAITWKKSLPHLLLFFVYFFVSYAHMSSLKDKYPSAIEIPPEVFQSPFTIIMFVIKYTQLTTYYFLSRKELKTYQKSIQHLFSETSRIDLNWVRWLVNGYMLLVTASIILFGLMIKYPNSFFILFLVNQALLTPYIYIATFKGITQPGIWRAKTGLDIHKVEVQMLEAGKIESQIASMGKPIFPKPGIGEEKVNEIISRIITVVEKEKLYQETDLTLQNLADKLQIPSYQVSQAINNRLKKNFYELINGYRVEEAKRLLVDSKNLSYTILSVGFEAGFNSKTTFNTVFKKFTGLTPTEYRERQRLDEPVA